MLSDRTVQLVETLFSRCLENDLHPDKLQFTKFLYLVDYCLYAYQKKRATDIDWLFFHYGPWAPEMNDAWEVIWNRFRLGMVDRSDEYGGRMPQFDRVNESLGMTLEGIIKRILSAFSSRSTNDVIEWCYKCTEPMKEAKRGDTLDFTKIQTGELPEFYPKAKTWDMPKIPAHILERRQAHKDRLARTRSQYLEFKRNMEDPVYEEAMNVLAHNNSAEIPNMDNAVVTWDREVVDLMGKREE